jgi:DNA-binding response OmpR family regulator
MADLVVVIDVDETERRSVAAALAADGLDLVQVESVVEGLMRVVDKEPSLIVIAEGPGPVQVVDVLPVIRRLTQAPVLVIGDDSGPGEGITLDRGADFFLARPFRPSELAVRARVLIQRGRGPKRERGDFPGGIDENGDGDPPPKSDRSNRHRSTKEAA